MHWPGPCACMGPRPGEKLCPCALLVLENQARISICVSIRARAMALNMVEKMKQPAPPQEVDWTLQTR